MCLKSTLVPLIFPLSLFLNGCIGDGGGTGEIDAGGVDAGEIDAGGVDETASLNWTAPTEREDGSVLALSAIAGFYIYYGPETGVYHGQIYINDHTVTQVQLPSFLSGKYFFVMTTIDTDGRESVFSNEVEMTKI